MRDMIERCNNDARAQDPEPTMSSCALGDLPPTGVARDGSRASLSKQRTRLYGRRHENAKASHPRSPASFVVGCNGARRTRLQLRTRELPPAPRPASAQKLE